MAMAMSRKPSHLVGLQPHPANIDGVPILATSPVPTYNGSREARKQLPLSLILLITSYLDNVGDIARVTRASRLLYYLNLPRLYEHVTLRSYPNIRYFDGQPEGLGAGSPFAMGLDGLVSRPVAGYVRTLTLVGHFKEHREDEFEKGRIPDNTMMLNIVIRAAIDKMDKLESFRWELSSNPMKTVYQGLSSRATLTSLIINFPTCRIPRPTVIIPGIPSLKYLHLKGMDPLCYNDDPSLLLLEAKRLETLKLEWNPRMRREREPSIQLSLLFGRCFAANYRLPIKHYAMKNLFARKEAMLDSIMNPATFQSLTAINCMDPHDPGTIFIDSTWMMSSHMGKEFTNLKKIRIDKLDEKRAEPLTEFENLEEIYLINRNPKASLPSSATASTNGISAPASPDTPITPINADVPKQLIAIGSEYLAAISSRHGKTLKKLLLSDRWSLSREVLMNLVRECPNLEQLGVAIDKDISPLEDLKEVCPNLKALRTLLRRDNPFFATIMEIDIDTHCFGIGARTAGKEYDNFRWFGIGDLYFRLGDVRHFKDPKSGQIRPVRVVTPVSWDVIKDVEIWGEDTLDL
ncbi:uncharacterized protein PV09_05394 [Verruconis gallopava]|uniref:F-box domain-containing protein n=1 Tax=Verruconis gallopava TaxID=253628 RepID=A0A0D1XMD4_9PEZI|nr:uncharacterized protein PV09_05394 [Verruconis gallopava]KIW03646.1 hypothetical protein PV09_05394 [Verruconis gallopava]